MRNIDDLSSLSSYWTRSLVVILLSGLLSNLHQSNTVYAQSQRQAEPAEDLEEANEVDLEDADAAESADQEPAKDASTEINVKNADIAAIVKIFSKKTKRNYILDDKVKGKVSIYLPGKVSADESLRILESVLAFKGFTSVPIGDNLWKIVPSREARQTTIPTLESEGRGPASAAVVTRLLNLKYVSADEMKQIIAQLVSPDGLVNAYTGTNSLIIIDSEDNVRRVTKITESLDVPFSNRDMTIIPIQFADAKDVAEKINEILGEGEKKEGGAENSRAKMMDAMLAPPNIPSGANRNVQNTASNAAAGGVTAGSGLRVREPKIIPDERTNSIIVVADEDTTLRIRALITQLDSKVDLSGNKFYVYRCQHADAEELAQVLSGLDGGSSGSSSNTSGTARSGMGLGETSDGTGSRSRTSSGSQNSRTQDRLSRQTRTPGRSRNEQSNRSTGTQSAQLGENISITADNSTNSLIISASKTDYLKLLALLKQLDIKRRQVLVDALILEVAVEDTENLGMDFITSTGGKDGGVLARSDFNSNLAALLSDPTKISSFSIAAASSGSLQLPNNITIPTQSVLLTALKSNSNVNVLSSPNILATDNESAEIVVGENVPFLSSVSTSETNLNNTFNQIDRQDVGITLRLTPQISSEDFVTLQVFTEVSSVIPTAGQTSLGPTTRVRTTETTVIAKDGQMIVTGGLLSDDVTDGETGIPYLKDIPVLGQAFKSTVSQQRKRNLLIFITPHIVKDQFDARDLTKDSASDIAKTIDENNINPTRDDVLHSREIDRVSESADTSQLAAPGTIIPPEPLFKSKPVEKQTTLQPGISAPVESSVSEDEEAPLELHVKPNFLEEKNVTGDRYIVLSLDGATGEDLSNVLPFLVTADDRLAALVIPRDVPGNIAEFFKAGDRYFYGSTGLKFVPLGVFGSKTEALVLHPQLAGNWYTLSPYELLNLGKGPWFKE